jgi:hypothetical protein
MPTCEVVTELTVDDASLDLQQQMGAVRIPAHLIQLRHELESVGRLPTPRIRSR